ncbi:MAG: hypothetical protein ACR2O4_16345 [Hyphomicrobiaceae bacterium]
MTHDFFARGWCRFGHDPALAAWVDHARPHARATVTAPEYSQWHRYGGTWFAGVNALPNDRRGIVGTEGPALRGTAVSFIRDRLGLHDVSWDRGQVSVCYPGYPQPMDGETPGALRYRRERDAAHVDGLHPVGPKRRRHLKEHHGFILGIPVTETSEEASPLVVWEGSHKMIRAAFQKRYTDLAPESWNGTDVTEAYQTVRQEVFETCPRVVVHAIPGEAYLVHRLALHGVAPWSDAATSGPDGRMIIYFRPEMPGGPEAWLNEP